LSYPTRLCSIPPWMWMALQYGFCFLNLLNYLQHRLLQPLFFLLVNNTICFSWLSILEHLFFNYFTSCRNINIHHIHIYNDYLCLNNKLNLNYRHRFPMKHFLHLNKLWAICHFMAIQTTNVTCIWRCFLCFLKSGYLRATLFALEEKHVFSTTLCD